MFFAVISLLLSFIHASYVKPPSEPFVLAAYDPEHHQEHDHILHENVEKVKFDGTKVFLCDRYDESETFLEGRVLANSSYKVDNLQGPLFIRVDRFTHRLKLCPNGYSSLDFSIKKGLVYYRGDDTWTACYDAEEDASYVYQGTKEANKRFCSDDNSKRIVLKACGKYDTTGAIPNYPLHNHIQW
ncbi:hypothetical protein Cantr_06695 [Candida viswanathii]|uniref:Cell wall protein RHD3 n=1 Tax=Candida viswanathii TaxID=5486 RepID=A0A367XVB3_9ASCO|nr:hypothetical protein Cantr_06695 [Candida viswanathii]